MVTKFILSPNRWFEFNKKNIDEKSLYIYFPIYFVKIKPCLLTEQSKKIFIFFYSGLLDTLKPLILIRNKIDQKMIDLNRSLQLQASDLVKLF